jgi:hypothetical protein
MTLAFESIQDAKGVSHAISAQSLTLQAAAPSQADAVPLAQGGVLGAIVEEIPGSGQGAAAGTILVLAKGDDVELEAGQKLHVSMTSPPTDVLVAQTE